MHTRRILLFSVLLLMTPALAFGSTARLEGLGVIPDFVEDYANMFTYPVSVTRYPALVVGEIGDLWAPTTWDRGFGATIGLGEDNMYGVFGFMLRENSAFAPGPFVPGSEASQFDLLWGMNFGQASIGLRFDRSSSELEVATEVSRWFTFSPLSLWYMTEEPTINELNTMGLGFSAGFEVRESDMIEATFEYRTLDFTADMIMAPGPPATYWKIEDKGEPSYAFSGRGFFYLTDNMTIVPLVNYAKYDASWEVQSSDPLEEESADETITGVTAGVGLKVDVGSWFMFGLGFSQWKKEYDFTTPDPDPDPTLVESYELTSTSSPFFFGCLETEIRDWLTVRFGARKNLINEEFVAETFGGGKTELTTKNGVIPDDVFTLYMEDGRPSPAFDEPFVFSMGLGFTFGDLDIDATLNQPYPFTGMYWLSGMSEWPFGKISATYHY